MSKFLSQKYRLLEPYVPGEQPQDMQYLKLNTNESPFPPCSEAIEAAAKAAGRSQLYADPACRALKRELADMLGVSPDEVLPTGGSDEMLNYAFMAFCDETHPAVFPDITYGFYRVAADVNGIPYETIPLDEDFGIRVSDYCGLGKTIFIANPNAPTGKALTRDEIETIVQRNPNSVVVVDEAYVDFGAESAVPLIQKYENLLVTQTFSKSRSMAGGRLGFGVGNEALIRDLTTLKFSVNPYSVNRMVMDAAAAILQNNAYTAQCCKSIMQTRDFTVEQLKKRGFHVLDSKANFVFASSERIPGSELYLKLKANGVLIRHFTTERIKEFNRITIGTRAQMETLFAAIDRILEETV